ncbi:MAG TPA: DUF433 domain-containing protein [Vineibacter sp.]|nr:DUF433 domain-containing protein [Vineibacter sp.]
MPASFSPTEVALLADTPARTVEKAIEQKVLPVRFGRLLPGDRRRRRLMAAPAVGCVAVFQRLELALPVARKRALAKHLATLSPAKWRTARVELAPAVELNVGRLTGDAMLRAERYRVARDAHIVIDPDVLGNTPVIRGTRLSVYAVGARLDGGDSVNDVRADYPDVSRAALAAAALYARAHPLVGRPGGRPWLRAA